MQDDDRREYYFEDEAGNTRVTPIVSHVARGRCSGLPDCRVLHYVSVVLVDDHEINVPPDWGYRPCPDCARTGNRVQVRHCADEDGRHCTCGAWSASRVVS